MKKLVIVLLAGGLFLTGCGDDSGMTAAATADLRDRVERVERAVADGDPEAAANKLLALEDAVSRWLDDGAITEERAARILSAATAVALRLEAIQEANPEPTPTIYIEVTETATETVTATPTEDDKRHGWEKHADDQDE